jgi:hypothetical protein
MTASCTKSADPLPDVGSTPLLTKSARAMDRRGVDLISGALPFGRLWYEDASAAVDCAKHRSRSRDAAFSEKAGSTPGRFKNIWRFRRSPCRLLRLPKRIGLKSYLRLSALVAGLT